MVNFDNRLEVPYNFSNDYLYYMNKVRRYIRYVYAEPYFTDGWHARINGGTKTPTTWEDYSFKIKEVIADKFEVYILLQSAEYTDMDIVNKYIDIGVSGFITSCDKIAYFLKENYKYINVICSITKLLSYNDICLKDLSMYDAIVLNFPFERGLEAIKKLPNKYKYHMIINNDGCIYNCNMQKYHWSNGQSLDWRKLHCHTDKNAWNKLILFYPNDLEYFDKYIDVFKMQGREYESRIIYNQIVNFRDKNNNLKHTIDYFNDAINDGTIKMI